MLCSWLISMYSLEKYQNTKLNSDTKNVSSIDAARGMCVVAAFMFVLEFLIFFYAVSFALSVKVSSSLERFVHIFFSVFLTLPYILAVFAGKVAGQAKCQ